MEPTTILLVSPDLMATSRLAGLAREAGAAVETLRDHDDAPRGGPYALVLLDLQAVAGDPAVIVARVRAALERAPAAGRPRLVAFGPHVAKERLDDALTAGCDDAVSRRELMGAFGALVRRWCDGG